MPMVPGDGPVQPGEVPGGPGPQPSQPPETVTLHCPFTCAMVNFDSSPEQMISINLEQSCHVYSYTYRS
jgi:hypothetical protein